MVTLRIKSKPLSQLKLVLPFLTIISILFIGLITLATYRGEDGTTARYQLDQDRIENSQWNSSADYFLKWSICQRIVHHLKNAKTNIAKEEKHVFLMILIPSGGPKDRPARDVVRRTWLNVSRETSKTAHFFVVGTASRKEENVKKLQAEAMETGDLLLLDDVVDSYRNLSLKMWAAFTETINKPEIGRFDYLLKTDLDSYVNIPGLVQRLSKEDDLKQVKPDTDLVYVGYFAGNGPVNRYGQWMDTEWNLCDKYLPYASGGGYVLSYSAVDYIAKNAKSLRIAANEDTQLGLWMASLNVRRIHDLRFNTAFDSRGCNNNFLISHKVSAENLTAMHELFLASNSKRICPTEYSLAEPYTYNWEELPSNCCAATKELGHLDEG